MRSINWSKDFACVWHPGRAGTDATKYPSESFSTTTSNCPDIEVASSSNDSCFAADRYRGRAYRTVQLVLISLPSAATSRIIRRSFAIDREDAIAKRHELLSAEGAADLLEAAHMHRDGVRRDQEVFAFGSDRVGASVEADRVGAVAARVGTAAEAQQSIIAGPCLPFVWTPGVFRIVSAGSGTSRSDRLVKRASASGKAMAVAPCVCSSTSRPWHKVGQCPAQR
jgi:hypothetical protein